MKSQWKKDEGETCRLLEIAASGIRALEVTGEVREADGVRWGKQGACKAFEGPPHVIEKEKTNRTKS